MSGIKWDENKLRWDLLPWDAIEKIVEIYSFGAAKYSSIVAGVADIKNMLMQGQYLWRKNQSVSMVAVERFAAEECADLVTKSGLESAILSTLRGNGKIIESGKRTTNNELQTISRKEQQTQRSEQGIKELNGKVFLEREVSQSGRAKIYWNSREILAQSVEEVLRNVQYIWIMIVKQGTQEDIYVAGATTDLECLEMILKDYRERLNISKIIRLQDSSNLEIFVDGDNNWQGVESERYFAALMRHLVAREKGEKYDKESGKLHSAHAAWNCIALLWNDLKEELNVGKGSGSKVCRESKKG